ncbi:MAG: hypothetical protein QOE92_2337 [Chloroflexota bacterium]|jgi:D-serine deaminase-like pyridoxal phosphate-dependent protein|nr:hypothetical protein [Chloroflexota bacterium]
MSPRPATTRGAVVVRSADPELQLQGLRAALALALGDRPADLYLVGEGAAVLEAAPGSEAAHGLETLAESGIALTVEAGTAAHRPGVASAPRGELLARTAAAAFQQTF